MMKRSPQPVICAALSVLLLWSFLMPLVSAAEPTATATVPPILQACAHASYPQARFTCSFPGDESAAIPDGPPYIIHCIDNSSAEANQSIASWSWDFGDGGTSTDKNPQHTYTEASSYDIRLTVATFCGKQYSNTTVDSISIYCSVPESLFTTNVTEGYAPLAIQVTDASLHTPADITTWTYWFDDTHFSHKRDPVYLYSQPGTYTINQTVWKECVQLGSTFHPPATRQITVTAPPALSPDANETNTTLTATIPPAVPVEPTSPAASGETVTVSAPDTEQNAAMLPGTGTLSVTTNPAGAQVYIDNVLQGTSPANVPALSAGSHTLRLERDGYQSMTLPVMVNDGTVTAFSTTLAPVSGGIAIVPVIALSVITLATAGAGIYLYKTRKRQ
ncbi:MAG: PEGA domain-containing protein [Methanoregulaceae archaeon]|nr:MAG: PEGA domain-containing protein [Methanoregulaceae archaeon]